MIIAAILITTLSTVLLMLSFRPLALAVGLVDRPGGRKRHVGEVPVIGGLAMFLGVAIGMTVAPEINMSLTQFMVAGGILVVIGSIDDRFGLPATVRLIAQLVAVLIMVFGAGLIMRDIGDPLWIGTIQTGPLSLIVTALIFMSVINAYNLADGLDGLAGSMVVVALLSIAVVAGAGTAVQLIAFVVAAAVAGYLVFNLPVRKDNPIRAFMGDAGSTFLGFVVVWLTVSLCQGEARLISPVHGLWFAAIPIYDLFTCFVRRVRGGRSPFDSGRDHFHHILRESGMSVRRVVATLVGLQMLYASFGIASANFAMREPLVFTIWAVLGISQLTIIRAIGRLFERSHREQVA